MAFRRSGKLKCDNLRKPKAYIVDRWVKNVTLVDIRKVGLLPPGFGDDRVSKEPILEGEDISRNSCIDRQYSEESIEGYVSISRSGVCFVDGCSFTTKSFVSLLHHVLCSHEEVNEFNCPFCSHSCSLCDMVEHLTMHGPSMFQCKYCPYHHFSHLKVCEHIKSKHPGSPLVVVELRDFKEEDYDSTEVVNREIEVEIVEKKEEEPIFLKEEPCEWDDLVETEMLDDRNLYPDKSDDIPTNFDSELNNDSGDLRSSESDAQMFEVNDCVERVSELEIANGNVFAEESNVFGGPESKDSYSKELKSKASKSREPKSKEPKIKASKSADSKSKEFKNIFKVKGTRRRRKVNYGTLPAHFSFKTKIATIEKKINLKSTSHNYHSSELELKKDALEKNWQCGLCDYVGLYNNMIAHAESAHDVQYQFQCSKCCIFIPSRGYVESHCLIFHPKSLVHLIANYYLPGSSLPFTKVTVSLPDGQEIFNPDNPEFSHKIPMLVL